MDNQQVRLVIAKSWLAGMIDADGCITFAISMQEKKYKHIDPVVDITTSCKATIRVLVQTIKLIGAACYVYSSKRDKVYNTRIAGYKRLNNFLPLVIPYMVTKQGEAINCLEFCKSRLSIPTKPFKAKPYTQKELDLIQSVKKAKITRNLRDYMPNILWLQDKDIVRPHDESVRGKQK